MDDDKDGFRFANSLYLDAALAAVEKMPEDTFRGLSRDIIMRGMRNNAIDSYLIISLLQKINIVD